MRISSANFCASCSVFACVWIVAAMCTSRPPSPCSRISPNLCSTVTVWLAPSCSVFWKSREVDCCVFPAPAALAAIPQHGSATHTNLLANTRPAPFIAVLSPELPAASPAFPDTSPATGAANARWMDYFLPGPATHRWPNPAPSTFPCNSTSAVNPRYLVAASSPLPAFQSHRRTPAPFVPLLPAPRSSAIDPYPSSLPVCRAACIQNRRPLRAPRPSPPQAPSATPPATTANSKKHPSNSCAAFLPHLAESAHFQSVSTEPGHPNNPAAPRPPCSVPSTPALPPHIPRNSPHASPAPPTLPPFHP